MSSGWRGTVGLMETFRSTNRPFNVGLQGQAYVALVYNFSCVDSLSISISKILNAQAGIDSYRRRPSYS